MLVALGAVELDLRLSNTSFGIQILQLPLPAVEATPVADVPHSGANMRHNEEQIAGKAKRALKKN
jgi:hypothetical protein